MRLLAITLLILFICLGSAAQKVSVDAVNRPATDVFAELMRQTGKNFVYRSDDLKGVRVTIHAAGEPLAKVLGRMFAGTYVDFKIKKKTVILRRRRKKAAVVVPRRAVAPTPHTPVHEEATPVELPEVTVTSRLEEDVTTTAETGALKLTDDDVMSAPVLLGEPDVVKALQRIPGVAEGNEGMAGMYVHGGNADENLYMLDNVPLYQVNHFAGLFSAFNADAIRYIDFFKSSVPARYDGRLSSFLDVRTRNGNRERFQGTARLGLTSGALSLNGPIGTRTSYAVAMRRSWFDVLTIPLLAMINAASYDEKFRFQYYFMDLNGKLTHRFSQSATGFFNVYFGNDYLKTGVRDKEEPESSWFSDDSYTFNWGNLLLQTGLNLKLSSTMNAEFTAAYTRFFSSMKRDETDRENTGDAVNTTRILIHTDNHINDWIARADFTWRPDAAMTVRFGAKGIIHSFLPARTSRQYQSSETVAGRRDSTYAYHAGEGNIYIEADGRLSDALRINAGVHGSLFGIDGKRHVNISPRLSAAWFPAGDWAVKGAYTRTVQYVHQLNSSYLSLPSDQWVPVTGSFRPQTADKISVALYCNFGDGWTISAEAYRKWMHNLLEYRDEYYLRPPLEIWDTRLCQGKGTAKGVDVMLEKKSGRLTGHVSYSLAWSDRTFADKNGGVTYPTRFDNRHTFTVALAWQASDKVTVNATWTGHSGNRFTLLPQMWQGPDSGTGFYYDELPLKAPINNYRLPFYHRLDLGCTVKNSHGYWNFGLYNAYCHLNTVAVRLHYNNNGQAVFQKVKLLPLIPSVSYTWIF